MSFSGEDLDHVGQTMAAQWCRHLLWGIVLVAFRLPLSLQHFWGFVEVFRSDVMFCGHDWYRLSLVPTRRRGSASMRWSFCCRMFLTSSISSRWAVWRYVLHDKTSLKLNLLSFLLCSLFFSCLLVFSVLRIKSLESKNSCNFWLYISRCGSRGWMFFHYLNNW
jgi:hypothetical protein